jgi:inner membrane protein involved in colicin E2 resistance
VDGLIYKAIAVGIIELAFIVYFIFEIIRKSKE